jgi:glycosyltransferase involved in cell wall biosynthesis
MKYKISVVIPVYNGSKFIERAIDSVLQQTVAVHELIIVNDGSTDDTAEKIARYGASVTLISIPNGGVANARNVGVSACTGDLIAFLDADDVWGAQKLEVQLKAFDAYPNVGFCCCDYTYWDHDRGQMLNHFAKFANDNDFNYDQPLRLTGLPLLLRQNFVGTCSAVMFRSSVIKQAGAFDGTLRQSEDYDMWIRMSLVTDFMVLSTPLFEKTTHETNLTNNFLETMVCHETVLLKTYAEDKFKARLAVFHDRYWDELAKHRFFIGDLYYERGKRLTAFIYYIKGIASHVTRENLGLFIYHFSRKLIRTLSFGLIRNRS